MLANKPSDAGVRSASEQSNLQWEGRSTLTVPTISIGASLVLFLLDRARVYSRASIPGQGQNDTVEAV